MKNECIGTVGSWRLMDKVEGNERSRLNHVDWNQRMNGGD